MNRWASRNPERATDGQMSPHPNTVRTSDVIHNEAKSAYENGERNDRCSSTTSDNCGKCFGCVKREDFEHDARQERGDCD